MKPLLSFLLILGILFVAAQASNTYDIPAEEVSHDNVPPFRPQYREQISRLRKLYSKTFYCGCDTNGFRFDPTGCGYASNRESDDFSIQWEHIFPVSYFSWVIPDWYTEYPGCERNGKPYTGRSCLQDRSLLVQQIALDPVNLVPISKEINQRRGSKKVGFVTKGRREFGRCEVKFNKTFFEPPKHLRGDIARIIFYMEKKYSDKPLFTEKTRKLYKKWAKEDPISAEEKERARKIYKATNVRHDEVLGEE